MTEARQLPNLEAAAADYLSRGWKVVPLTDGKTPRGIAEWQNRTFDPSDFATAKGVGVQLGPASRMVDVEWDTPAQHAAAVQLCGGAWPNGPEFKSSKGGHKPFAWDDRLSAVGSAIVDFPCEDGTKLKVRVGGGGKGAQVAFPPSPGKQWLPGKTPDDLPLPALPAPLIEQLIASAPKSTTTEDYPEPETTAKPAEVADCCREVLALPRAVSGESGSDATIHAACVIRRHGIYGEEGRAMLDLYNQERCDPPWSEAELDHKWRDAKRLQMPRGWEFDVIDGEPNAAPIAPATDKAKGFSLFLMQWSDFQAADFPQRYLIPGLVVEGEHLIVGGRTKGLKTMVSLDMMISLASGQPFLGHFPVAESCPVAFLSGESGKATLQRAAAAMAAARGAKISDDRFFIGFDLPRLSNASHLDAIAIAVRQYGIKLFCIDPAYLATLNAGNTDKASNQFAMGLILEPFGHIGAETGCTMALVHHAKKTTKAEAYKPMTRDDLTQSGFDAWMRQWILLSRRSPFKRGLHELHMGVGGSAGHCGEWHVDVDEGQPADELVGRRWQVTVSDLNDADAEAKAEAEDIAKLEADAEAVRQCLANGGNEAKPAWAIYEATKGKPRGLSQARVKGALEYLVIRDEVEPCQYVRRGRKTPEDGGYRLKQWGLNAA